LVGGEHAFHALGIAGRGDGGGERVVGELGQERRRVVIERVEARRVELGEDGARIGQPAEPEVVRDPPQRLVEGRGALDSAHEPSHIRGMRCYLSQYRTALTGSLATGLTNA